MFSRILAMERQAVPSSHAVFDRDASNSTRPTTTICRCAEMTFLMYRRSRSPRSANTSSWIASNSFASFSSSCSPRRESGVSPALFTAVVTSRSFRSQFEFDIAFGGVDTDPHVLLRRLDHIARAQVTQLARLQRADAGMTYSDSAAEREVEAGLLAGLENRRASVTFDFLFAVEEADGAALAGVGVAADLGLEPLEVQAFAIPVRFPVLDQGVEHLTGTRAERLAF